MKDTNENFLQDFFFLTSCKFMYISTHRSYSISIILKANHLTHFRKGFFLRCAYMQQTAVQITLTLLPVNRCTQASTIATGTRRHNFDTDLYLHTELGHVFASFSQQCEKIYTTICFSLYKKKKKKKHGSLKLTLRSCTGKMTVLKR